jgi:hypothetical protein
MSINKFMYISGESAYQKLWKDTFNCLISMRYLKTLYQNLEIMIIKTLWNIGILGQTVWIYQILIVEYGIYMMKNHSGWIFG